MYIVKHPVTYREGREEEAGRDGGGEEGDYIVSPTRPPPATII